MSGELAMEVQATSGAARAGLLHLPLGTVRTPCFMPVGTRGSVKALDAEDLEALGAQIVLANTYHLMLRPGPDVVAGLGGIGAFSGWAGRTLTDSGGFQIHSLGGRVDADGVSFTSVYDGAHVRLTPESAVDIQAAIGADVQMVLDVCASLPAGRESLAEAVETTSAWASRARARFLEGGAAPGQVQFGIVQGGTEPDLRARSAEALLGIGFDGYAVGGLSVGEPREAMLATLETTVPLLPADRPRYLMGVGDPLGMVEAIGRGIDLFDCVAPTRAARHGTLLTSVGRISLRNARYRSDDGPIDAACGCRVCHRWSRGYLRHLLSVGEPSAQRLLSIHNLAYVLGLAESARRAVLDDRFAGFLEGVRGAWGP